MHAAWVKETNPNAAKATVRNVISSISGVTFVVVALDDLIFFTKVFAESIMS